MFLRTLRRILPALALAALLTTLFLAGSLSTSAGEDLPEVVARIGTATITDDDLSRLANPELQQLAQQRYLVLERNLERLVEQRLVEIEAARRGLSVEDLAAREIAAAVTPVSDAEVEAWYRANEERIRQPREAVAEQIRGLLDRQRREERQAAFLTELRQRHGVTVYLEPPRVAIDLAGAPVKGPAQAPVTVVEFSDFQCPACQRMNPNLVRLRETFGDKVRIAFRQFPLTSIHPQAFQAAEAALCAGEQGKFWPMHDALFADQGKLGEGDLKARARTLGLDAERFDRCLATGQFRDEVEADVAAGQGLGVTGTPTLFINGRPVQLLSGTPLYDQLARVVEDELARAGR